MHSLQGSYLIHQVVHLSSSCISVRSTLYGSHFSPVTPLSACEHPENWACVLSSMDVRILQVLSRYLGALNKYLSSSYHVKGVMNPQGDPPSQEFLF